MAAAQQVTAGDLSARVEVSGPDEFRSLTDSFNRMVATLEKNGYDPTVFESDDGFGWGMWQGRMAEILEALFPLE